MTAFDPVLQQEYQITNCSEENKTIKLESNNNIWIGVTNTTNGTGYVVSNCTFDYCVLKPVNISLSNPDEQCAYNRSGVLCGECEPGLSLVLGTSRCELCSNQHLPSPATPVFPGRHSTSCIHSGFQHYRSNRYYPWADLLHQYLSSKSVDFHTFS